MPVWIIEKNGMPQAVKARASGGWLLSSDLGKPLIDESKLSGYMREQAPFAIRALPPIPYDDQTQELKKLAQQKLGSERREIMRKARKIIPPFKGEASYTHHEYQRTIRQIKPAMIPVRSGLLAHKINAHIYCYSPDEIEQLRTPKVTAFLKQRGYNALLNALDDAEELNETIKNTKPYSGLFNAMTLMKRFERHVNNHRPDKARMVWQSLRDMKLGTHEVKKALDIAMESRDAKLAGQVFSDYYREARSQKGRHAKAFRRKQNAIEDFKQHAAPIAHDPEPIPFLDFIEHFENTYLDADAMKAMETLAPGETQAQKDAWMANFLYRRIDWKAYRERATPVHDALLQVKLPEYGHWTIPLWRDTIGGQMGRKEHTKENPDLLSRLYLASQIETKLTQNHWKIKDYNPQELMLVAASISYPNHSRDTNFSEYCLQHYLPNEVFERGRKARLHKVAPEDDKIPALDTIDGENFGYPGFYMRRIQRDEPMILMTGNYVQSCDAIGDGDAGSTLALSHVTSPYGGCYGLFQKAADARQDMLVGKVAVWLGEGRKPDHYDLVFNSWESKLNAIPARLGQEFVRETAKHIIHHNKNIERVLLGNDKGQFARFSLVRDPAIPIDAATATKDSDIQRLIYSPLMARSDAEETSRNKREAERLAEEAKKVAENRAKKKERRNHPQGGKPSGNDAAHGL